MRPKDLKTKIFLDSGDPAETKSVIEALGWLDGQTTNPSLVVKNTEAAARFERGEKISEEELLVFYKKIAQEISGLIPNGSVSLEVYADNNTTAEQMFNQGEKLYQWIPNAHIKYPVTAEGLKAAEKSLASGMRVNITLVFSQEQAAAVAIMGKNANQGDVFLSPFVGRLDDRGEDGMELIKNIITMYRENNSPVEVLTASIRSIEHLKYALALRSDILTAPYKALKEWVDNDRYLPDNDYQYPASGLKPIPVKSLDFSQSWDKYDLKHELTDSGLDKFAADWNKLIKM
ncbi:transaldolase family protein [Patescibacteria group bacterium]